MQTKIIERYFFFGLLLATFILTFFIFSPFWVVIVLGICFAIALHPLHEWLIKKGLPNWLSSLLSVLLFAVLLLGPILGIGAIVFNQSQNVYQVATEGGNINTFINSIDVGIKKILPEGVSFDTTQKISDLIKLITDNIAKIFSSTLSAVFSFVLMLLAIFFFLKDGANWKKDIIKLSPLADTDDKKILDRLETAINGVIKGYLLIAVVQGILMGFGLWVFGVNNAALWGVVAGVCSLIPMVGTAFVSVPAIIFLFVTGHGLAALGMLIWAVAIVGMVDNFLSPMVISGKTNIPPLLILFSVLGGVSLMGPIGVLMGPLTISLLYTLVSIYKNEFSNSLE